MRKENTKKFKINVMDILVILLVLICIASIVIRATSIENPSAKEYTVYFKIDDISASSYSYLQGHAGESVKLSSDGAFLGTLGKDFSRGVAIYTYTVETDVGKKEIKQAYYPAFDSEDIYSEQRCSVNGTMVVVGTKGKNGIFINGDQYIAPEMLIEIETEYIKTAINIIRIEEK